MSTVSRRSDHRPARRRVAARGVIIVYFFLATSFVLTMIDKDRNITVRGLQWAVWAVAAVPLTGAFVLALQILGAGDRGRAPRRAFWAVVLTLLGVVIVGSDLIGALPQR
jgi:cytochrome bd-type quinol oxidase subunit 2